MTFWCVICFKSTRTPIAQFINWLCKKKLDTIHAGNLEAHVKRSHSVVYHEMQIDKEKIAAKRKTFEREK